MKHFSIFLFLALFGCAHEADGRPKGGIPNGNSPPPSTCPYTFVPADDGCLSANQNAQVIVPTFFTLVRQTSQAQYKTSGAVGSDHPPTWNVPGVDYPVGAISADGSLTVASALSISGCTYSAGPPAALNCSGNTDKTISGGLFNDVTVDDGSTNHTTTFTNNHFIIGYNNCHTRGSQAWVIIDANTHQNVVATNNTWSVDPTCSFVANLFGLSNDPGLTVNSTGVANFSGAIMCYTSGPTLQNGTPGFHLWQHAHFTGQVNNTTNNSTSNVISAPQIISSVGGGCYTLDTAQTTATGVTVTTGPQLPDVYGALSQGEIGIATFTAKYNAFLGLSTLMSSNTGGSTDIEYNYAQMNGDIQRHVNLFQQQPTPCDGGCTSANATTIANALTKFNTAWFPGYAAVSGTTIYGPFTTSGTANAAPPDGYQITYSNVNVSYNVGIANQTMNGWNGVTSVTTSAILRTTNQIGTPKASYTAVVTAGSMVVSLVTGTINIGDYVATNGFGGGAGFNNTSYLRITSGSGTTWALNQSVSFSGGARSYLYPGTVTSMTMTGNAMDWTGAYFPIQLDTDTIYGSTSLTGNWNLVNGAACNTGNASC